MVNQIKSSQQDLGETILAIASFLEKGLSETINEYTQITLSQHNLLLELSQIEQSTQKQLSALMAISRPAVNKLVTILEKKELLTIETSKSDRRETVIKITKKGRNQLNDARELSQSYYKKYFKFLSDEEIVDSLKLLGKI
jgi:DNA-binding MarR family transcriptional regulator